MGKIFADFNMEQFWERSEYAQEEYVGESLTDETVAAVENELG